MKSSKVLCIIAIAVASGTTPLAAPTTGERAFFIEEKIFLNNIPADSGSLQIWIPYPVADNYQKISEFKLDAPLVASFIKEKEYGNRVIYLSRAGHPGKGKLEIALSFKVSRKESDLGEDSAVTAEILSRFTKADRLVPVNGRIKELARKITAGKKTDMEKARAIYDYIANELTYSRDDPKVCGIGDSLLTLQHKKGICSDYHSLFISLARSLGIPAKFEIGFPVPQDTESGTIKGYHCWAKFYVKEKGWVPVDISEADKHPERLDYFFGHIDENRVHLTTGRDIGLKHAKGSGPLNFFVYPYAELNGSRIDDLDIQVTYKDLKGGVSSEKDI